MWKKKKYLLQIVHKYLNYDVERSEKYTKHESKKY